MIPAWLRAGHPSRCRIGLKRRRASSGSGRPIREGNGLFAAPSPDLFSAGQFLSQLMQARDFDMDLRMTLSGKPGDMAGIGMMGYTYFYLALSEGHVLLRKGEAREGSRWEKTTVTETTEAAVPWPVGNVLFRMQVRDGNVRFFYGADEQTLAPIGGDCAMSCGGWTGARPGIFAMNIRQVQGGWADIQSVCVRTPQGEEI